MTQIKNGFREPRNKILFNKELNALQHSQKGKRLDRELVTAYIVDAEDQDIITYAQAVDKTRSDDFQFPQMPHEYLALALMPIYVSHKCVA